MRDIRNDLKERLTSISAERIALQTKANELFQAENGIKILLREEEERFARQSPSLFAEAEAPNGGALRNLIVTCLAHHPAALDLEEIKSYVASTTYDFGDKKPGRAIHFALLGLGQNGMVEKEADGKWKLKQVPVQETTQ